MRALVLLLLGAMACAHADPLAFPSYPRAEVLDRAGDDTAREYTFALAPVEKIRRELKIENALTLLAKRRSVTHLLPDGTSLEAAIAHYDAMLAPANVRFRCRGRDCGGSSQWANQIFGMSLLYGPDANQFYLAGEQGSDLVSVYVVQRGNRRVYAHLVVLEPEQEVAVTPNQRLVQALTGRGHVVVRGIEPARTGTLDTDDLRRLSDIGAALEPVRDQVIYVVCHLYAPGDVTALLARAQTCAETAAEALAKRSDAKFLPFAAGPMLPREAENHSRIELVMPHRQERD
jgi:outer membrane lipoprotein-sorting protein